MPFNFSSPEYLSPHKRQKNRFSPVSRASPAHMNSPETGEVQYVASNRQSWCMIVIVYSKI